MYAIDIALNTPYPTDHKYTVDLDQHFHSTPLHKKLIIVSTQLFLNKLKFGHDDPRIYTYICQWLFLLRIFCSVRTVAQDLVSVIKCLCRIAYCIEQVTHADTHICHTHNKGSCPLVQQNYYWKHAPIHLVRYIITCSFHL